MKIIKQGQNPDVMLEAPWWEGIQETCSHCGTVVELEAQDARGTLSMDVDKSTGVIQRIRVCCPVCNQFLQVMRPLATTSLRKYELARTRLDSKPENGESSQDWSVVCPTHLIFNCPDCR